MTTNLKGNLKGFCKLACVWTGIFLGSYILLETLFFCCTAYLFPYGARVSFGFGIYPLLQTSKKHTEPTNYVAIFGDSFGFGAGDHFHNTQHQHNPSFNVTHYLHEKTGRDYISFAIPGSSNLCGWIEDPIASINYINASMFYRMEEPAEILLYFYEGNDIQDTWRDLQDRYVANHYETNKLGDRKYFSDFITEEMLEKSQINLKSRGMKIQDNFMLLRYISNASEEKKNREQVMGLIKDIKPPMPGTKNIAIINGENHPLPDKLPAPPVEMPMQDIEKTLLFINSIADYVNNRFSRSRISIIYIPTTTSSYQLINEITDVYAEGTATATATATSTYATMQLNDMSNKLCDSMRKIAVANGFNFLDTRPGIREKGKRTLLHGPLDWGHPNEAGYKALSEEIDHFMSALDSAAHGKMVGDCAIL